MFKLHCHLCGKDFKAKNNKSKYCSDKCKYRKGNLKKIEKRKTNKKYNNCEYCGNIFSVRDHRHVTCSESCRNKRKSLRFKKQLKTCKFTGCKLKGRCNKYCYHHYNLTRIGEDYFNKRHTNKPVGWKFKIATGYIKIKEESGNWILEHHKVIKEIIGRHLIKNESVHHINGDRSDNRPENLELWSKSHPSGQRIKDKVKWAREILRDYGDMYPDVPT